MLNHQMAVFSMSALMFLGGCAGATVADEWRPAFGGSLRVTSGQFLVAREMLARAQQTQIEILAQPDCHD